MPDRRPRIHADDLALFLCTLALCTTALLIVLWLL